MLSLILRNWLRQITRLFLKQFNKLFKKTKSPKFNWVWLRWANERRLSFREKQITIKSTEFVWYSLYFAFGSFSSLKSCKKYTKRYWVFHWQNWPLLFPLPKRRRNFLENSGRIWIFKIKNFKKIRNSLVILKASSKKNFGLMRTFVTLF